MKTLTMLLLLLFFYRAGYPQSSSYSFGENPATTHSGLLAATTIHDISPLIWRFMGLPSADRFELDHRRKLDSIQGYYLQPPVNNYPNIVTVVHTDISTFSNGRKLSAHSTGAKLTPEQKNILAAADISSNIELRIKFLYKNYGEDTDVKDGSIDVTVLPEQEARYHTGGFDELAEYLREYVKAHDPSAQLANNIQQTSILFTVTENGSLSDIRLRQRSGNAKADQLVLEAMQRMPKWKPARNAKGMPVRQTIHFAFGGC